MRIEVMDREAAKSLGSAVAEALAKVAEEYGVQLKSMGGKFDDVTGTFSPKVEFSLSDSAMKAFERDFRYLNLHLANFEASDFGREFTHDGKTYKISGINRKAPKYPIEATEVSTGRFYKFPVRVINVCLGRA